MVTGYSFPAPHKIEDYDALRATFEWNIPTTYNIAEAIFRAGNPDALALYHVCEDESVHTFSYRDIDRSSDRVAATLASHGVSAGDRIVLCFPQCPEVLVLHLAAFKIGAITVPSAYILGQDSIKHTIESTDSTSIWLDSVAADRFSDAIANVDTAEIHVVELSPNHYREESLGRSLGGLRPYTNTDTIDAVVETCHDDPAMILYTSGTSGSPKGVVQAHQYLIGTLPGYQLWFHFFNHKHNKRVWTPSSWAWAGALFDVVFPTLAMGGTVCAHLRRAGFDPSTALTYLDDSSVSRVFFPATALRRIKDEAEPSRYDLSKLSVILCGGEYLSESHRKWAQNAFETPVNVSYGTTEANALIGNCQAIFPPRKDSIGLPYPGHNIRIVDDIGEEVETGAIGRIIVSPPDPVLFQGYWNDETATKACFSDEGYFITGDLGRQDRQGYIYYEGRGDEVIITSGYRVSPREIEDSLESSPQVLAAIVGAVDDPDVGNRIVAYVMLDADAETTIEALDLQQYVKDRLGMHKAPHEIMELRDPPMTHSGKIDRASILSRI